MSRISSGIPIYALTPHDKTRRKVALFRGVYPVNFKIDELRSHAEANEVAADILKQRGVVEDGDLAIFTKGDMFGRRGGTNAMKVVEIGNLVEPPEWSR